MLTTVNHAAWRIGYALATLACAPAAAQDVFSLQVLGPEYLAGDEGMVLQASYPVLIEQHVSGPGAQAWSFGVTSSASTVTGATTEGTAADLVENGGLRRGGFEKTETIDPARNGGRSGAVSAVVLSFMDGVGLTSMVTRIATFDVDFPIPAGSGLATITFDGSLRGSGLPVKLAVTQEGETKVPRLQSRVVRLTAVPPNPDCCAAPLNLGFSTRLLRGRPPFEGVEGTGPRCHAGDGVIDHAVAEGPQKVFVNIVSDLDDKSGGVGAWSLSIAVDGGGDMLSATTSGTAADRKEDGGLFFGGFNKTQLVDPARNGGRDGAISACVLSLALGTTLPLRGTESVLALEVSGPEGATSILSAAHPLRVAQPIPTVLTVRGDSRIPCNLEEASLRIRHLLSRSFIRGDANGDLRLDIADPVWTVSALYHDGPPVVCADSADSNDDGLVDASDVVHAIEYLFRAGSSAIISLSGVRARRHGGRDCMPGRIRNVPVTPSRGSQAGRRAGLCVVLGALLAFAVPLTADDPKDLYERAEQARKTGKPRLSRVLFRQLLEQAPDHVDGHVGYQKLLQSQGKEPDLTREYEKLLEERSEPWAYYLLGRVLHDPPREEALYRKGLEKDPGDGRLRKALASALRRQLRREEAEAEHREILSLDPDDIDAHTALAYSMQRRGKLGELVAAYGERAEKEPGSFTAQMLGAIVLSIAGRQDEALERLEKARGLSPQDSSVMRAEGLIRFKRGDTNAAREILEKVREQDPHNARALSMLGAPSRAHSPRSGGPRPARGGCPPGACPRGHLGPARHGPPGHEGCPRGGRGLQGGHPIGSRGGQRARRHGRGASLPGRARPGDRLLRESDSHCGRGFGPSPFGSLESSREGGSPRGSQGGPREGRGRREQGRLRARNRRGRPEHPPG